MSPSRAYHDSIWLAVDANATPEHARLRERFLLAQIAAERARLQRPARVLDLGCGDGHFARALVGGGASVVAADVAAEALRRAAARAGERTGPASGRAVQPALGPSVAPAGERRAEPPRELELRLVDADAPLPFDDACFDAVWAGETIEHVADTTGWLSQVRRVLRPRGLLLLSTPDHGALTRLRLASSARAFARHFDPRSDHLRFYTRRGLTDLLADFGFEEVEVRPVGGVPGARRVLLGSARRTRF